ncbi:MAG: glycosyltransferase [Gammaproteobacteria bacterium]
MPLKVLTITNMYPEPERPAWGVFIKSQVDSLVAQGIETDVMVIRGYRGRAEYLCAIPRLWRRLRSGDYDLIHAHYGLSGLVARMQRRLPVVVSYCGNDLYGHADAAGRQTLQSMPLMWLQRLLARCVDRAIVKSRASADLIAAAAPVVIPNGVDMTRFRPLPRDECRATLGLARDATYVLFPYAIDRPRKNHPLFSAALAQLASRHGINALPLVVHDVPNERVPLYLNAADVVMLTSFWEGSPNVVKEAMACNTRVVAVDVGDVRELVGGETGYAVCGFDAVELADALATVLATPAKTAMRARMQALSSAAIAARVIDVYRALARH